MATLHWNYAESTKSVQNAKPRSVCACTHCRSCTPWHPTSLNHYFWKSERQHTMVGVLVSLFRAECPVQSLPSLGRRASEANCRVLCRILGGSWVVIHWVATYNPHQRSYNSTYIIPKSPMNLQVQRKTWVADILVKQTGVYGSLQLVKSCCTETRVLQGPGFMQFSSKSSLLSWLMSLKGSCRQVVYTLSAM